MYADSWEESAWTAEQDTRADLLAIAAELEAQWLTAAEATPPPSPFP